MIVAHPDVIKLLFGSIEDPQPKMPGLGWMPGIKIVADPYMRKHPVRWVFPKDRFVEYEPSDEEWCRFFGIGHEEEDRTRWNVLNINEQMFEMIQRPFGFSTPTFRARCRATAEEMRVVDRQFKLDLEHLRRDVARVYFG